MFDSHFEAVLADTPEAKRIHYQLRYRVYCLETSYEDLCAFPRQLEEDPYDANSAHFIVRSRATGEWMAAMRLVIGTAEQLPVSKHCRLDEQAVAHMTGRTAEVSRLCVISDYRRRRQERHTPYEVPWRPREQAFPSPVVDINERRREPEIMLGLIRAARAYSLAHGINHWLFLAAGSLARILRGLGLHIETAGPECEFRGKRRPFHCEVESFLPDRDTHAYEMFLRAPAYRSYSGLVRARELQAANGE